jgi:hypothetical protein
VLQNPVVLHHPDRLAVGGHSLWVDLAELVRTSCGRPEELLYLTGNLADATDPSAVADPAADLRLPELITDQLRALVAATAGRRELGVEVAGHANPTFTRALYDLGVRRFTSTAGQAEELRLALGQLADRKDQR